MTSATRHRCGFGLKVPPRAHDMKVFAEWAVSFHGCPSNVLPSILQEGQLLMPGDMLIDGTVLPNRLTRGSNERIGLYTSPSIKYSELDIYTAPTEWQGSTVRIVLQCRQNLKLGGAALRIEGETIGWQRRFGNAAISRHFSNQGIERFTKARNSIIPYRVLVGFDVGTREQEEELREKAAEAAERRRVQQEEEKARKAAAAKAAAEAEDKRVLQRRRQEEEKKAAATKAAAEAEVKRAQERRRREEEEERKAAAKAKAVRKRQGEEKARKAAKAAADAERKRLKEERRQRKEEEKVAASMGADKGLCYALLLVAVLLAAAFTVLVRDTLTRPADKVLKILTAIQSCIHAGRPTKASQLCSVSHSDLLLVTDHHLLPLIAKGRFQDILDMKEAVLGDVRRLLSLHSLELDYRDAVVEIYFFIGLAHQQLAILDHSAFVKGGDVCSSPGCHVHMDSALEMFRTFTNQYGARADSRRREVMAHLDFLSGTSYYFKSNFTDALKHFEKALPVLRERRASGSLLRERRTSVKGRDLSGTQVFGIGAAIEGCYAQLAKPADARRRLYLLPSDAGPALYATCFHVVKAWMWKNSAATDPAAANSDDLSQDLYEWILFCDAETGYLMTGHPLREEDMF